MNTTHMLTQPLAISTQLHTHIYLTKHAKLPTCEFTSLSVGCVFEVGLFFFKT